MSRNIHFTDDYLYMVTKKLHRLVQINIRHIINRIKNGESCPQSVEEGKVLGIGVADFFIENDDNIWILGEDSTVEKYGDLQLSRSC